jgi:hypothetical protein
VVQSEFQIDHRVFIPYNWVNIPHPLHMGQVAKGDSRSFDSSVGGTLRISQTAIINPYKELVGNDRLRDESKAPGTTKHFNNNDVINFDDDAIHSDAAAIQPSYIDESATAVDSGEANVAGISARILSEFTNDSQTFLELKGSASEPLIILAAHIDWEFRLGIQILNPLKPKVLFSGKHDGFPAYEIYINANHETLDVTEVLKWAPPRDKDVIELMGDPDTIIERFEKSIK